MTPREIECNATASSAARMDLWCTSSALSRAAYWMRVHAGVPQSASVWYAHTVLANRAEKGDRSAARKLAEFDHAATEYEGDRVSAGGVS
jgi:hypothetical protein